jgi:histidine ammonia-lyase
VFDEAGISSLVPVAKDALAIVSNNAVSAALAALAIDTAQRLLQTADIVYALSLEGLNGNVSPLLPEVVKLRSARTASPATDRIRAYLDGSYLWHPNVQRPLQDPLSFKVCPEVHDLAERHLGEFVDSLTEHINQSDDNPAVVLSGLPSEGHPEAGSPYTVQDDEMSGWVLPTANFLPLSWVLRLESFANVLGHVSRLSANRTLRLSEPEHTGLPRFLSEHEVVGVFGAVQKLASSLDAEGWSYAPPVSLDFIAVAGDVEDHATNAPLVVERLKHQMEKIFQVLAVELIHAAQAISLRERNGHVSLGKASRAVLEAYRQLVPLLGSEEPLSPYIQAAHDFLRSGRALNIARKGRG